MRDFKNMKRQRGRNRSGGGGGAPTGGGKPQQNANRAFESNGPDNLKIRGHAQHVYEKYQQLARDAMSAGDRVLGENFLQHAEHYFRLIRTLQPNRPYTDIVSREGFASGYDIDFEDEGGEGGEEQEAAIEGGEGQSGESDYRDQQPRQDRWENRGGEGQGQNRADQPRQDYSRQDRGGQDQNRQDQNRGGYANGRNNNNGAANGNRDRNDRGYNRDRNEGRWENRNGEGQGQNQGERIDAARVDNNNNRADNPRPDNQPGEDRRPERSDRPERQDRDRDGGYGRRDRAYGERGAEARDPLPVIEPQAAPLTTETPAPQAEPTAPPKSVAPAEKPARTRVLRSRDGDESHTPAFLQAASTPAPAAAEEAPVKRPRGRPKKVVDAAPTETEEA